MINRVLITPGEQTGTDCNWVKSSQSFSNGNCVEAAALPGEIVGVRDSKDPSGPVLRFAPDEWLAFLRRCAER
jgi:Domain of unknown function (DUF397)